MDTDERLARAAAGGDRAAFTQLVERHERGLRNLLDRLTGDHGDDLAQETFIRAWRLAGSFSGTGSYRAWLFRIGWRVYLSNSELRPATVEFDPDVHGGSYFADPVPSLDLDRALASLTERERAAAILCFGQGCSHQEAAEALDLPLGTLKSMASRARLKLSAFLEGS